MAIYFNQGVFYGAFTFADGTSGTIDPSIIANSVVVSPDTYESLMNSVATGLYTIGSDDGGNPILVATTPPPYVNPSYVTGTIGTSSGTYTITPSNSVPTITGWGTLWTANITPTSASSKIKISFSVSFSVSVARTVLFLIARDTTVIAKGGQYGQTVGQMFNYSMEVFDYPQTISSTTYTCYYAGQATAGTVYFNQQGSGTTAYTYGSAMTSPFSIQEI